MIKAGVIIIALVSFLNAGWFRDVFSLIRIHFDSSMAVPLQVPIDLSKKGVIVDREFKVKETRGYVMEFRLLSADMKKNDYHEATKAQKFLGYTAYSPYDGKQLRFPTYDFAKEDLAMGGVFIDESYNVDGTIVSLHVILHKIEKDGRKKVILDKTYITKGHNDGGLSRSFGYGSLDKGKYSIKVKNIEGFSELKGVETSFKIVRNRIK